jgi:hypothetical protein
MATKLSVCRRWKTFAQTSCDSAGSSDTGYNRAHPSPLPATKPETQPSESPELVPAK